MSSNFERVLRLVRQTGDRLVVFDKPEDDAVVVMNLDDYEGLIGLQDGNTSNRLDLPADPDVWDVMQSADDEGDTWDVEQMTEGELAELECQYQAFADKGVQETMEEHGNEPVVTQDVHLGDQKADEGAVEQVQARDEKEEPGEDFGEESFYLEPIE